MNTLQRIVSSFKRVNPHKKAIKNKQQCKTIYGSETVGEQAKRQHLLHYVLKYRIAVPALILLKRWVDKKLYQSPKGKVQFEHVELFEKAFDEATIAWLQDYIGSLGHGRVTREQAVEQQSKDQNNTLFLNTIKKSAMSLFMNDDAYLEWLVKFTEQFNKYSNEFYKEKAVNGKVYHVMHTVPNTLTPEYEHVYLLLREKKSFEVFPIANKT